MLFATDISPKSLLGRSRGLRPCFADARKWLHQCMADHVECSQQIHDAPTRLLYIHSSQVEDCVRLIEPPRSAKMRYAALSHCWGQLQPLRTTKMTFEIHKQGIRLGDLPQTFQDAVVVAKELDIEYLWIDSLCIIQDSVQDWERECSKMSSVYSGAWVTIAASDAADSSQGFLHNYVSSKFDSWNFTYSNGREDALVTVSVTYKPEDLENHLSEPKPRLSERGWALQERLLSQRILSFRTNRMSWECSKLCYSDDMHYPYTMEHLSYDMVDKRSIRSLSDLSTAFEYWYETVMTYTKCQLTKNTDKLPALSGLAQAFSDVLGDTYVAGLWKNDIHVGLTWYNWRAYSQSECNEENPPSYRAPSWSWACSDVGIHFRTEIRNQPKDLIIVSVGVNPKGLDPFGEVSHGTLCVNGRVKEGGLGLGNSVKNRQPKLYNLDDTNTVIAAVHLDNHQLITKIIRESSQQKETLGLLVSYDDLAYTTWVGLVLENIGVSGGKRVFRRIGIILCNENYVAGYNWFHGCKRESLEIV